MKLLLDENMPRQLAQSTAFTLPPGEVEYIYAEPRLQALDKRRRRGEFAG